MYGTKLIGVSKPCQDTETRQYVVFLTISQGLTNLGLTVQFGPEQEQLASNVAEVYYQFIQELRRHGFIDVDVHLRNV